MTKKYNKTKKKKKKTCNKLDKVTQKEETYPKSTYKGHNLSHQNPTPLAPSGTGTQVYILEHIHIIKNYKPIQKKVESPTQIGVIQEKEISIEKVCLLDCSIA